MRYQHTALILLLCTSMSAPVQAGFIFGRKKDKIDPKQRVPELIALLESDKDADKRTKAADELREYDPAAFPTIVPALIGALQKDAKAGVRIEAAHSLSKVRPVSSVVGEALEQAVAKDESMRVRLQARSALLQYHWAGYRGKKSDVPPPLYTNREPPLATEKGPLPPPIDTQKPAPAPLPAPRPAPQPMVTPSRPVVPPAPPSNQSRIRITPLQPKQQAKPIAITPLPPTQQPLTTKEPPLASPAPILAPMPPATPAPAPAPKPTSAEGPILE